MTRKRGLPPLVAGYSDKGPQWQGLQDVDFDLLGFVLSCHLVIEHYIDHFLSTTREPELAWADARLQFWQKVALIARIDGFAPPYDFIPAIKHLNSIRNRFSHDVTTRITLDDVQPLKDAVLRASKEKPPVLENVHDVLEVFTTLVCAWFGGAIYGASSGRRRKSKNSPTY